MFYYFLFYLYFEKNPIKNVKKISSFTALKYWVLISP